VDRDHQPKTRADPRQTAIEERAEKGDERSLEHARRRPLVARRCNRAATTASANILAY
jgi:hypothetical protein